LLYLPQKFSVSVTRITSDTHIHFPHLPNAYSKRSRCRKYLGQVVTSLAFEAQYLMDPIFAIAVAHLRSMYLEDRTLANASHGYMASAVAQYRSLLTTEPDGSNAEALFVTSSFLALHVPISRLFPGDDLNLREAEPPYVLPLSWFHSYEGVKAVVLSSWKWIGRSQRVLPIICSQPAIPLNLKSDEYQFFNSLLEGIDQQLHSVAETLRGTQRKHMKTPSHI
jgi:hypothetical protein